MIMPTSHMRKVKLSDANDLLLVPNPVSGHWPLTVWLWSPHYLYQSIQPQIMSISPLLMMITDLMMQSYRNTSLSLEPMKQEHKKKILEDWLEVYGLQYTIISALKMKRKKLLYFLKEFYSLQDLSFSIIHYNIFYLGWSVIMISSL